MRVPVVVVGIGEGGSGGALAIGFGDRLIMLENAYYSVISPEMCASILYKDAEQAEERRVVPADDRRRPASSSASPTRSCPSRSAARTATRTPCTRSCARRSARALDELAGRTADELVDARYERLRRIGVFAES